MFIASFDPGKSTGCILAEIISDKINIIATATTTDTYETLDRLNVWSLDKQISMCLIEKYIGAGWRNQCSFDVPYLCGMIAGAAHMLSISVKLVEPARKKAGLNTDWLKGNKEKFIMTVHECDAAAHIWMYHYSQKG